MRFACLGSGSSGNAWVVEAGHTRVLVDCGFGVREFERRLAGKGLEATDLSGIVLTHEHSDHAGGAARVARKYRLPVWLTYGTFALTPTLHKGGLDIRFIDSHQAFAVDDLQLCPYPVPHDAREPVQFVLGDGVRRLGMLTDIGGTTPYVEQVLSGCDALVLECNHDWTMLQDGPYSAALKRRIGGRYGHLSNDDAGALLVRLDKRRLQCLVAAHLSEANNTAVRVRETLSEATGCDGDWVEVAGQESGCAWRRIL